MHSCLECVKQLSLFLAGSGRALWLQSLGTLSMRAPSSAYPIQGRAQAFMESVSHNFCFGLGVKSVVAAAPVVIHREFGPWGRAVPTYVLARGLLLPASPHPGLLFAPNRAVTCGRRTGPCISPERRACSFPVSMSPFLWHSLSPAHLQLFGATGISYLLKTCFSVVESGTSFMQGWKMPGC